MRFLLWLLLLLFPTIVMAVELELLWDFNRPEVSEQRFKAALQRASGDNALILRTQIARTYGLRRDFMAARNVLKAIESQIRTAGAEARTRYLLELGRTYASASHDPAQLTPEAKAHARSAFQTALQTARTAGFDVLAIDAIHMFAFLDTSPGDQLKWGQEALGLIQSSSQADAKRWEASVRNNIGYAFHQLGRYAEALDQFRQAVRLRERGTNPEATRIAYWMVAWTLRALGRNDEALEIQLRLEREAEAAGKPDPHVFTELAALYQAMGDPERAGHYLQLRK